ncbi:hypothetical protein QFC21_005960 [Naganishia friedmannii]|uniref:Uncharacterized protein n=1 Tax=Naganishia friedmannii TaxID=89922 RepID=A0ACC2V6X5_9TREE|nr:hypothetical protein QFC21_005960 [Naganishia friedmannii]
MLETFAKILFETQPAPFGKLDIKLQGNDTTTADMNVISNSSPNTIPKVSSTGSLSRDAFRMSKYKQPAPCRTLYAKETRDKDPSELEGFVTAELMRSMMDYFGGSCNGYDSARKEFTCSVEVGYNIRGSREDGKQV